MMIDQLKMPATVDLWWRCGSAVELEPIQVCCNGRMIRNKVRKQETSCKWRKCDVITIKAWWIIVSDCRLLRRIKCALFGKNDGDKWSVWLSDEWLPKSQVAHTNILLLCACTCESNAEFGNFAGPVEWKDCTEIASAKRLILWNGEDKNVVEQIKIQFWLGQRNHDLTEQPKKKN